MIWQIFGRAAFSLKLKQKNGKNVFKYSYLGKDLIEAWGGDVTNEEVCKTMVSPYTERVNQKFEEILRKQAPVRDESEYIDSKKITIKYRQMLVPLANSKGEIAYILGGMRWKPC